MANMTYSVGDVFYRAGITDEGEAYVDEFHLRSIRKGRAHITQKIVGGNWENGKWDTSIPAWCRKNFSVDPAKTWDGLPEEFAKSRAPAISYAIRHYGKYLDNAKAESELDADYIAALEKGLRTLKGFLTKTKNQAAKKKAANVAKRAAAKAGTDMATS